MTPAYFPGILRPAGGLSKHELPVSTRAIHPTAVLQAEFSAAVDPLMGVKAKRAKQVTMRQ
jgi:hypothetical protein